MMMSYTIPEITRKYEKNNIEKTSPEDGVGMRGIFSFKLGKRMMLVGASINACMGAGTNSISAVVQGW